MWSMNHTLTVTAREWKVHWHIYTQREQELGKKGKKKDRTGKISGIRFQDKQVNVRGKMQMLQAAKRMKKDHIFF